MGDRHPAREPCCAGGAGARALDSRAMADPTIDPGAKAATLAAALPYFRRYHGTTIVVKYGGHAMGETHLAEMFAEDVVLLKEFGMYPVLGHGGGPTVWA